jgi:outer membrane protein assembly factor BamB
MRTALAAALTFFAASASPGQDPPPATAEPALPEPPAELVGFAEPRAAEADQRAVKLADRAIAEGRWEEAAALLSDALGPPAKEGPAREEERLVTTDGILYTGIAEAVRRRVEKLPEAGLAAWRSRRGEAAREEPKEARSEGAPATAAARTERSSWPCVLGRHDRSAIDVPPDLEPRPGSYARWVHRLTNYRQLESSVPARNAFYTVYPMQVVALGDLLFARSHQDVVALDRASGAVRWRVDSDVPAAEQTHQPSSGFDSFRFFSDLGGWSLTVLPGEPDRLIVLSKPGRGTVRNGALEFARNRLLAFDARSGTADWKRGETEDPEESLRPLTFAAAPAVAPDAKGDVLLVPATSGDGFHVVALDARGKLLWTRKVYSYIPAKMELVDETMAHGASLATGGGIVAGAPGHGFVFALSTRGETLWLRRYPVVSSGYPASPRWAPGHPIIAGGKVIAAPLDGESLLVLDAGTGDLVWEKRPPSGYHMLIGADRERVYEIESDGRVIASSLDGGAPAWTSEAFGRPAGRGFVTSNRVYAAADRAVIALDAAKGTVLARFKLWDDKVPPPSPGNLFLAGGDLIVMAAWGLASIEPHEATWKTLDALGQREKLLRRSRLLRGEEKYAESLVDLRQALASTSDAAEAERLRAELLEVSQDAARTTRDPEFLRRVLEEPDLVPSPAHRTAFVLKSAEFLREDAPEAAAKLYRELIAAAGAGAAEPAGDLVLTPEGFLADAAAYASDALRELVAAGKVESPPGDEEKVGGWIDAAAEAANGAERLARIASRHGHSHAAAAAGALLARIAEEEGDFVTAALQLERCIADHPHLAAEPELREHLAGLRRRARPAAEAIPLDLETPWTLRFEAPTDLAAMAEGSQALPAIPALEGSKLLLVDASGKPAASLEVPGLPNLALAHSRVGTVLVEPALAHAAGGRMLVFTAAGLHEVLGLAEPGTAPLLRSWHATEHPLEKYTAPASSAPVPRTRTGAKAAPPQINDNQNFYARAELDLAGNVSIVEPDGSVTVFERRTGRLLYKSPGEGGLSAGPPRRSGRLIAVEMATPPGVAIHDLGRRVKTIVQAPATPWRVHVVPGIAAVLDSAPGIQVRDLTALAAPEGEPAPPPTLWRDAAGRGAPSVAFADASRVIAVEAGGKLVSRSLRSGRVRWTVPFPDGLSPIRTYELEGADGLPGDIIIAASRAIDPEDGRGVLGQRVAQDLHLARVSRDGTKRWELEAAKGGVAFDGMRIPVRGKSGEVWLLAFNQKTAAWKTRAVLLDIEKGTLRELFAMDLAEKPNHPPPVFCSAFGGIAVETSGRLAFFAPGPAPAPPAAADAAAGADTEGTEPERR